MEFFVFNGSEKTFEVTHNRQDYGLRIFDWILIKALCCKYQIYISQLRFTMIHAFVMPHCLSNPVYRRNFSFSHGAKIRMNAFNLQLLTWKCRFIPTCQLLWRQKYNANLYFRSELVKKKIITRPVNSHKWSTVTATGLTGSRVFLYTNQLFQKKRCLSLYAVRIWPTRGLSNSSEIKWLCLSLNYIFLNFTLLFYLFSNKLD
jgi:hypothetical protein